MIETLILLVIGLSLILLLLIWTLSSPPAISKPEEELRSRTVLISLEFEPPANALINQIIAQGDWEFICHKAPSLKRRFLQERKSVSLVWLREVRTRMTRLFRFHRLVVRNTESLSLAMEVRTLANYTSFILLAAIAQFLIYVVGPFRARWALRGIFSTVDRSFSGVGRTVAALGPAARARVETEWAQQAAPSG